MRRTRNSVVPGDLAPPYLVTRYVNLNGGLMHAAASYDGGCLVTTCCRAQLNLPNPAHAFDLSVMVTCLRCVICTGCPACVDGYLHEGTMRLGKWVTKDKRKLYPFEMDDTHLINSINKLRRDEHHFKDDWREWIEVLEVERAQRGLP